ncbi:hypothetical protein DPMN_132427 [Dreissena polymorpha]|uniref:Uncharacterized protein n=1 Tax=Dreissena polymorpha TaxID=45954 RepID=A0A9D4FSG7_DREPO|nr:hypothetical protein DPMN_132427 [Dreissena polymorpha]
MCSRNYAQSRSKLKFFKYISSKDSHAQFQASQRDRSGQAALKGVPETEGQGTRVEVYEGRHEEAAPKTHRTP